MVSRSFYPLGLAFFFPFFGGFLDYPLGWGSLLLLLTGWIFFLMVGAWFPTSPFLYLMLVSGLALCLTFTFTSTSLITFYFFFEASLIPTLMLILGWGYQPERLPASYYFLFYTLIASLPLLFILLSFSLSFKSVWVLFLPCGGDSLFQLFMVLAFLVKLPLYSVHVWLPKAHVEAPVTGSMVLAAILLKLGGYGLFLVQPLFSCIPLGVVLSLGLVGGLLSSLLSLRQSDLKSLIAYSSVAHMALISVSLLLWSESLGWGSLMMMVAHGLCSSALFFLSYLFYLRLGSRSSLLTRGLSLLTPALTLWWFLLIACNMGVPPSLNLFAELFLLAGLSPYEVGFLVLGGLISFFSAAYSLFLYSASTHGTSLFLGGFWPPSLRELVVLSGHWVPLLLLIFL